MIYVCYGSFTYLHPGSGSYTAIDLSLCSPDLLLDLNFKVEADSFGSDHFPIILEIGISLPDISPLEFQTCSLGAL